MKKQNVPSSEQSLPSPQDEVACDSQFDHRKVASFDYSVMEVTVLDILRLICASFSRDADEFYNAALQKANEAWMPFKPDLLVGCCIGFAHALRNERNRPYGFMSAICQNCRQYVCEDEIEVIDLIRAAGRQDPAAVSATAKIVAGHQKTLLLTRAAYSLAGILKACPPQSSDYELAIDMKTGSSQIH